MSDISTKLQGKLTSRKVRLLQTDYLYEQMIDADDDNKKLARKILEGQMYNHHLSEQKTE